MNVTIIGCGKIGSAIAKRVSGKHSITLFDHNKDKVEALLQSVKGKKGLTLEDMTGSDVIILAVKPKDLPEVAKNLKNGADGKLIISVLASVSVKDLEEHFPQSPVLRIMPNIALEFGKGSIALVETHLFSPDEKRAIEDLLSSLGTLHWIKEEFIDAFTAIAGSGPAFIFVLIEALVEGGIYLGYPKEKGLPLVLEMLEGACATVRETGKHPSELKWEVASPGGCTIAGLKTLEDEGVRAAMINTLLATKFKLDEMKS